MTERMIIRRCDIHTAWTDENHVGIVTKKSVVISITCPSEYDANKVIETMINQGGHETFSFIIEAEEIKVRNKLFTEMKK
jgi:hypothetical protein